ncbi:MAG: sigma 54-interacting transcriptional regulator [Spirochaetales bacterium]|nr:sigma 54-interacting transcriptional regulator [Spirochaetales bacterium]
MEIDKIYYRRIIEELTLLKNISRILSESQDVAGSIDPILDLLNSSMTLNRSVITIFNRKSGRIEINEARGLSTNEIKKGIYKLGEGITGKVIQSGRPIIIKDISKEKDFLDKTGAWSIESNSKVISFICVPIRSGNQVIGTLAADRFFSGAISLEDDQRLLEIVSSMIAQAVRLRRSVEEKQTLEKENIILQEQLQNRFRPENMIGGSNEMKEVYQLISQVARSEANVLIRGESGTGKELVAHAIHYNSYRKDRPFIKVNCAALPETIIESELFGHEAGSFTGAVGTRKGRFELANTGTIFLDEIGELSPQVQVKLLRVLQEREIERVGDSRTIKVDVRIIAATNRNLEDEMKKGIFREDLYYRLNVFPIHVPPLRERKSDLTNLTDFFIEKYAKLNRKNVKRISSAAIDLLMMYHWPGNVRELENIIERAVLLTNDEVIHTYHFPPSLQSAESSDTGMKKTLQDALDRYEEEILRDALKTTKGNRAKAARILGVTERIMGLRVDRFGIDCTKYK